MTFQDDAGSGNAGESSDEKSVVSAVGRRRRSSRALSAAKLSIGEVLLDSLSMYFKNIVLFSLIAIIVLSPLFILRISLEDELPSIVTWLLRMLLQQLVTAAIIYGVFRRLKSKSADMGKCLSVGLSRLLPLLGVLILVALAGLAASLLPIILAAFAASAIGGPLGFLLIYAAMIPWLTIYCIYYVAPACVVVERTIYLTLFVLNAVFYFIVSLILEASVSPSDNSYSILSIAIHFIIVMICGAISAVTMVLVYYKLKVRVEGADEDELASVFD